MLAGRRLRTGGRKVRAVEVVWAVAGSFALLRMTAKT
jgi:hypothetical protein